MKISCGVKIRPYQDEVEGFCGQNKEITFDEIRNPVNDTSITFQYDEN